ncbi:TPR domain protein [Seminavis robusta]|uniref:TPR domain protein n=1 Tax=Seminavis robusta TaxID=568900 RepID=A0A9N8H0C4_9STRA|nr:TPR domain protein [Seminavis robusta]|eukprot:Sro18_g013000.1 TPR domain protein (800) ;mRNA; f:120394-122793
MSFREFLQELSAVDDRFRPTSAGIDTAKLAQDATDRGKPQVFQAWLPPPVINRTGFIQMHEEQMKLIQNRKRSKGNTVVVSSNSTIRPHAQHGPFPPLSSLRVTTLREVATKVNHIHDDCILFVKTIFDSHRIVGTNLLVEDSCGDCLLFSLYNFVAPEEDPQDVFPKGTYLAILAPYMKNSGDDPNRNLLLRCDNPECIRIFTSHRSWLAGMRGKKLIDTRGLDPSQLRKQGNEAFGEERYPVAARCYTRALDCPSIEDADKVACLSNLAEVNLRQELWEAAGENARAVLALDHTHTKAKYRLATALVRLNRFEEAVQVISGEMEKIFQRLRKDIAELLKEQAGQYKLKKIHKEAASKPNHRLAKFHANFVSPKIETGVEIVKERQGFTYRGCIATERIDANTLISSSRALVFCQEQANALDYCVDPYTKRFLKGSSMALENKLILLMYQRPALRESIYNLSSGLEHASNPSCKIDIKRIGGIVTSNTFGISAVDGVEETWEKFKQTSQCLEPLSGLQEEEAWEQQFINGSGFWTQESLFNHSCIPNCTWNQIGDQMFVSTTQDIEAGQELTLSYVSLDLSFSDREEKFRHWIQPDHGFQCECDWCHSIRSSPKLAKTERTVHAAYRKAAQLVSSGHHVTRMHAAAELAMPSAERQVAFDTFSSLPLALQHNACADLWVMEGACQAHKGNHPGALVAYEKVAAIKFAVRGGFSIERAKDLWRIVGASMANQNPGRALELLISIYHDVFLPSSVSNMYEAFRVLTLHYSMPWWQDSFDVQKQTVMERLIERAVRSATTS